MKQAFELHFGTLCFGEKCDGSFRYRANVFAFLLNAVPNKINMDILINRCGTTTFNLVLKMYVLESRFFYFLIKFNTTIRRKDEIQKSIIILEIPFDYPF
ncbi:hypothetical protein DTO10_07885 [Peribacillus butanolivorans]|uniref:Uncharacterized protein n=1 Tax=Peribacillus butanolivorans TaxID=421767 RepID=A0ABN5MYN6_9BACI|nr:hypothetical protein DTO10_07885 [Peribacillus butanolivorans]